MEDEEDYTGFEEDELFLDDLEFPEEIIDEDEDDE